MAVGHNPTDERTETFVREWFDLLSNHEPVERLLTFVADDDLEMVFPERTLHSHADFRSWYTVVGEYFIDQTNTLEEFATQCHEAKADITLRVVWRATRTSDGTRLAFRVDQNWQLANVPGSDRLVIVRYHVGNMRPI